MALLDLKTGRIKSVNETACLLISHSDNEAQAKELLQNTLKSAGFNEQIDEIAENGHFTKTIELNHQRFYLVFTPYPGDINTLSILHFYPAPLNDSLPQLPLNHLSWLDFLPDGIIIHHRGKILFANDSTKWLFRIENGQSIEGTPVSAFFPLETSAQFELKQKKWNKGEATEVFEFSMEDPDGETIYLEERTVHVNYSTLCVQLTILSNLSKRKHWIHERMRAQLAEEINQILKHEIREHKVTQRELEESRNFNQSVIESSMDMIIAEDQQGKISIFNKAAEKEFGYHRDEVIGKPTAILFKDQKEYKRVQTKLRDKKSISLEVLNKRKNGAVFTAVLSASRLYSIDGKYMGSMGVSRDITQQKADAENLRRREELYRDLFDNMSDAYMMIDKSGNLKYWNKAALNLLGAGDKDAAALNLLSMVKKEQRAEVNEQRKALKNGDSISQMEFELTNCQGKTRYVQVNSSPVFEAGKLVGSRELILDISEKKLALAVAEDQSARIKAIFESSSYLIWSVDENLFLTSYNSRFKTAYHKNAGKEAAVGDKTMGFGQAMTKADKVFWNQKYAACFSGAPQQFETSFKDDRGKRQWYDVFLNPIRNESGKVREISGIAQPVTFKKQAEVKIKDQTAKINSIFDSSAMTIWTLDKKFRITSFNRNFGQLLSKNMGLEIHIGDNFISLIKPYVREDLRPVMMNLYQAALNGESSRFEGMMKTRSGATIYLETFLNPIFKDDGKVLEISCMAHEITDKKKIERQIRDSLREKEILLQEVHHRVKNNLQVISSILNLQSSYVKDPNTLNILRESQNRIKSMSFIHESLYQTTDFSYIDFSDYILSLAKNLVHSYSINLGAVRLETAFEKVYLNLDQAIPCGLIVNELVSNALKYAFPDNLKGVLQLGIRETSQKITLKVKDNGIGVPEDFDIEKGDTLGLQLVFTLVEQLDGEVAFKSKPGKGTEYLITFDKQN